MRSVSVEQSPANALTDLDRYRLPQPSTDHTVARRLAQLRTSSVAQGPCPERSPTRPRRTAVAWASPEPGGCSGEKVGGGARARPAEWTSTPGHRTRAAAMAVPVLQEPFGPATAGTPSVPSQSRRPRRRRVSIPLPRPHSCRRLPRFRHLIGKCRGTSLCRPPTGRRIRKGSRNGSADRPPLSVVGGLGPVVWASVFRKARI